MKKLRNGFYLLMLLKENIVIEQKNYDNLILVQKNKGKLSKKTSNDTRRYYTRIII